jgi:DNA-binding response OmpR family regulator
MRKEALIVDDDRTILEVMGKYLENHGISVITAHNGAEGLAVLEDARPDIIITDAEMPGMDGFTFCKKIRENPALAAIPIVIMSGKKIAETDIVSGYDKGADDYIIKPFSYPVLLAKISAVMRHAGAKASPKPVIIKGRGFKLDLDGRTLKISGQPVGLTSKEMDLFAILASSSGRILSLNHLLEAVWKYDPASYNDPHTVEVHISNLRKKLGPKLAARLTSVPGLGYKFE